MNDEDLSYLEDLAKEPEKSKLDIVAENNFEDQESQDDYKKLMTELNLNIEDEEQEDEELKNIDLDSLFKEEDSEEESDLFGEDEEEKQEVKKDEPEVDEFENKYSRQKELRKELDELYSKANFEKVIDTMPELFDVSDEGIEEFKKDMAEYLKQEEVRNNINKKQVELAELDANNGSYEQATFKKKLDIVFNKAKEVNKNFDNDFQKFLGEVNEFTKDKLQDKKFAEKLVKIDNIILEDENAGDLMAYFSKKPDEYKKLLGMSEIEAVRVLSANSTKISMKRESLKKNKDVEVSQPLNTNVNSNTTRTKVKSTKELYDMSDDEFEKMLKANWSKIAKNY